MTSPQDRGQEQLIHEQQQVLSSTAADLSPALAKMRVLKLIVLRLLAHGNRVIDPLCPGCLNPYLVLAVLEAAEVEEVEEASILYYFQQ